MSTISYSFFHNILFFVVFLSPTMYIFPLMRNYFHIGSVNFKPCGNNNIPEVPCNNLVIELHILAPTKFGLGILEKNVSTFTHFLNSIYKLRFWRAKNPKTMIYTLTWGKKHMYFQLTRPRNLWTYTCLFNRLINSIMMTTIWKLILNSKIWLK